MHERYVPAHSVFVVLKDLHSIRTIHYYNQRIQKEGEQGAEETVIKLKALKIRQVRTVTPYITFFKF